MSDDKHEKIRQRAHKIWEEAGRPEGAHHEHWLQAEKEISASADKASKPKKAPAAKKPAAPKAAPAAKAAAKEPAAKAAPAKPATAKKTKTPAA